MSKNEKIVNSIAASMAMEDLILSDSEKEQILACMDNEITFDDLIGILNKEYLGA